MDFNDAIAAIAQAQPIATLAIFAVVVAVFLALVVFITCTLIAALKENDSTTYDRIIGLIMASRHAEPPAVDEDSQS